MPVTDTADSHEEAREKSKGAEKTASLYRMAMPGHLCPFGLKSLSMLKRKGYSVDDNLLESRDEVDAFKQTHDVKTTPVAYIEGERIGGYSDLKKHFGYRVLGEDDTTYQPVIAIFASTALMALAIVLNLYDGFPILTLLKWFFATSMVALPIHQRHLQSTSQAFSIGLEKPRRIRTKGSLNEHLERHKSVTGPHRRFARK